MIVWGELGRGKITFVIFMNVDTDEDYDHQSNDSCDDPASDSTACGVGVWVVVAFAAAASNEMNDRGHDFESGGFCSSKVENPRLTDDRL